MADISTKGGDFAKLVAKRMNAVTRVSTPRDYIGASIIATPCDRALFYARERVPQASPSARALRIFDFGDAIELLAVRWLRDAGFFVYTHNPATGGQFRVQTSDGTLGGHCDGVIALQRLPSDLFDSVDASSVRLIEVKSHKQARFNDVSDLGVRESKFEHYAQMVTYMHESRTIAAALGMQMMIASCLYVAVNKDTSEVYLEEVAYDAGTFGSIADRAQRIARAKSPPHRIANDPKRSPCKYCDFSTHCFADNRASSVPQ